MAANQAHNFTTRTPKAIYESMRETMQLALLGQKKVGQAVPMIDPVWDSIMQAVAKELASIEKAQAGYASRLAKLDTRSHAE